jgi:predicted aminopeptidase
MTNCTLMQPSMTNYRPRGASALALLLMVALLSGCGTIGYYAQAVGGHTEVLGRTQPIDEIINQTTDVALRNKLEEAKAIREFATTTLGLPDNDSYRHYADVGRPYVVWNVVATPEFSLTPKTWCFAIVGCIAYRGYYDEAEAREFAAGLGGLDVHVGGVRAYSTLGWFADPLLNTMLAPKRPYLASVMFHELAHQALYINDDSAFNEAFATAVERAGVARWIAAGGDTALAVRYQRMQRARDVFLRLALGTRQELLDLYKRTSPPVVMREHKVQILDRARRKRDVLMRDLGVPNAYATFFDANLNNARLASVATYYKYVPAFEQLLLEADNQLPKFYVAARQIGKLAPDKRADSLAALLAKAAARR